MTKTSRRTLLGGSLGGAALLAVGSPEPRAQATSSLIPSRGTLPSGIQSGDVTPRGAMLWARSDRPGRMLVELSTGRRGGRRTHKGPWATPKTDLTAKLELKGLRPGREYEYRIQFEDTDGRLGKEEVGHFSTPSLGSAPQSFVWTGDTAGQGYGINPDLEGMVAYRAMHALRPDFLIHSGDNI